MVKSSSKFSGNIQNLMSKFPVDQIGASKAV